MLLAFHWAITRLMTNLEAKVTISIHRQGSLNELFRIEKVGDVDSDLVGHQKRLDFSENLASFGEAIQYKMTG
jgi:hypothetical protein